MRAKPDAAWWEDGEWVHGERDAQGRLVGEVCYWDADGRLISTADHVDGRPHGRARRYFPDGSVAQDSTYEHGVLHGVRRFLRGPGSPLERVVATVVAYECTYEHGDLVGTTWRDADGREVDERGRPVPERPPGVPPGSTLFDRTWHALRRRGETGSETLERREWYEDGGQRIIRDYVAGTERAFHANGQRWYEHAGATRRFFDDTGALRRVSVYEAGAEVARTWSRPDVEPATREGPVAGNREVGRWRIGEREVDYGPWLSVDELVAHPASGAVDATRYADDDHSLVATLARVRAMGRTGIVMAGGAAWHILDERGVVTMPRSGPSLADLLHAVRLGWIDAEILADIASELAEHDRAAAALDVIEAALLLGDTPAWHAARTAYLRASGHVVVAASTLDARARALLEEIRAHPEADAPRLVFADHVAATFPEHTALIVAQCSGRDDPALVAAFLATLPGWLAHETPVRGFLDGLLAVDAEHFVAADPDLLDRIAPACDALELANASPYIAQLVTLPELRRYRALTFFDTYVPRSAAQQLARCPHLDALEHLGLRSAGLFDDALVALCTGTAFPNLQSLDIGRHRDDMHYGLDAARALGSAPFARTLSHLAMPRRWLGDGVIDVIARLPALVSLDLSDGALTDDGARALLALPRAWTSLVLDGNDLGFDMRAALRARLGDRVRFDP